MADNGGRLVVALEARLNTFERQMKQAGLIGDQAAQKIERRFKDVNPQINTSFLSRIGSESNALVPVLGRLALAFAGIVSAQKAIQAVDAFTRIQNQLKVTGLEGEKLNAVYQALYASAQAQGVPLEAQTQLYSRLSQAQQDLNATTPELLQFTNGVAAALKIQGTSATEASGALLQLSQALGGGKIQAEEYNSLLDGGRVILQAVANGLVEAGGSVSKLTALVKDGQVSSQAFFRALLAALPQLMAQAGQASTTISQANERVQNAFINLVGAIDKVGDVSGNTTKIIIGLADAIDKVTKAIPGYLEFLRKASDVSITVKGSGLSVFGSDVTDPAQWAKVLDVQGAQDASKDLKTALESVAEARRKAIEGGPDEAARGKALSGLPKPPPTPPAITPVSLKSFPVPGDGKGSGRGGGGRASTLDEFDREIAQVVEMTEKLELETAAVGQNEAAQAKAKVTADLLNAAKKAGIEITDEVRAKIDAEAEAYGQATQKYADAKARIDEINNVSSEFGAALNTAFTDAIVNGQKLNVVLSNLLKSLAQMAINSAFKSIFDAPSGGGTSVFGSLLSSIFKFHEGGMVGAGGGTTTSGVNPAVFIGARRFHTGLMPDEFPAILQRGEMVVPRDAVGRSSSSGSSRNGVTVTVAPVFNSGVTAADVAKMVPEIKRQTIAGVKEAMVRGKF